MRETTVVRTLFGGLLAGALLVAPGVAKAEPTAAEIAVARKLFADANALEKEKRWTDAEAKLREALSVKETPGLRYHLGFCLENQGKLVEALVEYDRADEMLRLGTKAPDVAELVGPAREGVKKRAAKLTLKLEPKVDGASIELDGHPVKDVLLDQSMPQNPGRHVITATADGRQAFRRELKLDETEIASVVISLPELGKTGAVEPKAAPTQTSVSGSSPPDAGASGAGGGSARTYVLVGEGAFTVIALGAGVFFTLKKGSDQDDIDAAQGELDKLGGGSSSSCNPPAAGAVDACSRLSDAVSSRDDHGKLATIGFIGAGVGAAATLATFLLWKPEQKDAASFRLAPFAGVGNAGLAAFGRF
jgi:tetratricopeptide (TPR) repeat protein